MATDEQRDWIRRVFGVAMTGIAATRDANGAAPAPASFVAFQKSRLAWDAARKKVEREVDAFKREVRAKVAGLPDADDFLDALDDLDDIVMTFDERLIDTLDDILDERTTPAEREALKTQARRIIGEYESYVASDPLVARLTGTTPGGLKLTIAATMGNTLRMLKAALR